MMIAFIQALIGSAAAAATPVPALQSAQPDDPSTITVIGERNPKQRIAEFVRAMTPVPSGRQISRFQQAICPTVAGLPQAQDEAVARRLRAVARTVGIDVASAGCDPNIVVIVTPDKTALLEQIRKHRPEYFGNLSRGEIRRLLAERGPAAAWHLEGPALNARGVEIVGPSDSVPINRTTDPGSYITAAARPQFASAIVVVDQDALAGLTTTQLADYAAMRALAKTDPAKILQSNAPTILRVLDAPMGTPVPVTLTNWDFGFLRGLYTSDPTLRPGAQRSAIVGAVIRRIEGAAKDAAGPSRAN